MRPNDDEIRGKIDEAAGTAKEKIGRVRGDVDLESEGSDQRISGNIESGIGKARRKIGEAAEELGKKINE